MLHDPDANGHRPATDASSADGGLPVVRAASRMEPGREQSLVARAGTDGAAFGALYDFYLPRIYGFIFRRTRERSVTEDLTAATFERALAMLRGGRFRNDAFGGWLYRVAANAVIDHVRAAGRLRPVDYEDELDPAPDALAAAIDRDELRSAMTRISPGHRRVLALRFFDDLGSAEASTILGCSQRTFAVKLHRAIGALRAAMVSEAHDTAEVSDVA